MNRTTTKEYSDKTGFIYGKLSWGKLFHSDAYTVDGISECNKSFLGELSRMSYIDHSLKVLGIEKKDLSKLSIFNVGTGREAIYLAKLGAKEVTHMDISAPNVKKTNAFILENNIKNLISINGDLQEYRLPQNKYDLIFLAGIYQHLNTPAKGLINISQSMKLGGKLYMGWYRSGEWRWFICELIRRLVNPSMSKQVEIQTAINQCFGSSHAWQVSRIMDDFFIPAHHEFHPKQIKDDAALCGLKIINMDNDYREYSHEVTPLQGQDYSRDSAILDPDKTGKVSLDYFSLGADRAYFEKITEVNDVSLENMQTTIGIDQFEGINYKEDIIKENIKLCYEVKQLHSNGYFSDQDIVSIAINLYRFTRPTEADYDSYYNKSLQLGRHEVLNRFFKNLISLCS